MHSFSCIIQTFTLFLLISFTLCLLIGLNNSLCVFRQTNYIQDNMHVEESEENSTSLHNKSRREETVEKSMYRRGIHSEYYVFVAWQQHGGGGGVKRKKEKIFPANNTTHLPVSRRNLFGKKNVETLLTFVSHFVQSCGEELQI